MGRVPLSRLRSGRADWPSRLATRLLALPLLLLADAAGGAQGVNLIVNGNAESGAGGDGFTGGTPIPGWAIVAGDPRLVLYSTGGGFPDNSSPGPSFRGSQFFAGGPDSPASQLRQTIDVSSEAQPIDLGIVEVLLSGWFGGFATDADNARVTITFLNGSSNPTGSPLTIGPITEVDRGNATGLLVRSVRAAVPAGSRSIRVDLLAATVAGPFNDGYADNLSLVLQSPDRRGGELPVNTFTSGRQSANSVAMDSSGNFVVAWTSEAQDGGGYGVFAQRFDNSGIREGTEIAVNSYTTGHQTEPSVSADASGNFVVSWTSGGQDGSGDGVFGQRFNSNGVKQGVPDFPVNTTKVGGQSESAITLDPSGNFVVVWATFENGSADVFAQRFNTVGTKQGSEFRVHSYVDDLQLSPALAIDNAGDFVVVWTGTGLGDSYGIFGQRFDSTGDPLGSEFLCNSYTTGKQDPGVRVAGDGAGNFVVVWTSNNQDGSNSGVFGQRFDAAGVEQGPEFKVNTYTTSIQSQPDVAMDDAGNFVVVWQSDHEVDGRGIFGQQFDMEGCPVGSEFQINTSVTGNQSGPQIVMSPSGDFVVAWNDFLSFSQSDVRAQRLSLRLPFVSIAAGGATSVCKTGTGTTVTARDAYPPVSYQWGRRSASEGPITPISGETAASYVLNGVDFPATGSFFLVCTTFPLCGAARTSNEIPVTVTTAAPTTAAAGPDQTICSGSTTAPLGANTPSSGTGAWSVVGGGTGTFSPNASSADARFHHTGGAGPITLRWTISSACSASQDDLTISLATCSLEAAAVAVDAAANGGLSNGDGVLSPGERVRVQPSWHNLTGSPVSATGAASAFSGPAGGTYTLNDAAAGYGSVGADGTNSCVTTGNCYEATVSAASRPLLHWDADFDETLSTGDPAKNWILHVGDSFTDVPRSYLFYRRVETVLHHGITAGCSATQYCPNDKVRRDQMGLFLGRAIAKGGANIPDSGTVGASPYNCISGGVSLFTDVAPTDPTCKAIHYIASKNVTGGCGGGAYCASQNVTRAEMGIFVARGVVAPGGGAAVPLSYGPDLVTGRSYSCDSGSPDLNFTDITTADAFCKHVHYLWAKGIVSGCSATEYCVAGEVTRGEMARFLSNAFAPNLYEP